MNVFTDVKLKFHYAFISFSMYKSTVSVGGVGDDVHHRVVVVEFGTMIASWVRAGVIAWVIVIVVGVSVCRCYNCWCTITSPPPTEHLFEPASTPSTAPSPLTVQGYYLRESPYLFSFIQAPYKNEIRTMIKKNTSIPITNYPTSSR